ncbi:hypothetical protein ACS0TY_000953 [Phlomoides rotata]
MYMYVCEKERKLTNDEKNCSPNYIYTCNRHSDRPVLEIKEKTRLKIRGGPNNVGRGSTKLLKGLRQWASVHEQNNLQPRLTHQSKKPKLIQKSMNFF